MSFASTVNGFSSRNWSLEPNKTIEHQFAETLSRMDGKDFFSYLIWRLPQGKHLENVIRKVAAGKEPSNYIQTAGRASALTIEIRKVDDAGEVHHWTIGRRGSTETADDTAEIHWDSFTTTVSRHDVFDAAAAAKVFSEYIRTGDVADVSYTKRPTVLG